MRLDRAAVGASIGIGTIVVLLIIVGFIVGALFGSSAGLAIVGIGLLIAPFALIWMGAKALQGGRTAVGIFTIIVALVLLWVFVAVGLAFILVGLGGGGAA